MNTTLHFLLSFLCVLCVLVVNSLFPFPSRFV